MKGKDVLTEVRYLIDDPTYSRFIEINQAYRKITKITQFNWLRVSDENMLSFVASTSSYTLDMTKMRVLQRIMVKGGTDSRWRILEEAPPLLFEQKVRESTDSTGAQRESKPKFFKIEGAGRSTKIEVTPTPDLAYEARVDYIKKTDDITLDSDIAMPEDYKDTLAKLASGYILRRDLTKPERAQLGVLYIQEATQEFEDLVRDSHPNRTFDIDRIAQPFLE